MTSIVVPTEPKAQPTYFFDLENTGHLGPEAFRAYMQVLQVLCYDRIGEDFTGTASQMRALMYQITVFDIFVVTRALSTDPSILTECQRVPGTMPDCYATWMRRIAESETPSSMDSTPIEPIDVAPTTVELPAAGTSWADIVEADAPATVTQAAKKKKKAEPDPKPGKKPGVVPPPKVTPPSSKAKDAGRTGQPPPRPASPVTHGMTLAYRNLSRKQRANLDFHRKIPIVKPELIQGVNLEIRQGKRYRTRKLAAVAAGIVSDELPPWQNVYDALALVYRPTFSNLGPATSRHHRIEDCVVWRSLPSFVFTHDKEVWNKVPADFKQELATSN